MGTYSTYPSLRSTAQPADGRDHERRREVVQQHPHAVEQMRERRGGELALRFLEGGEARDLS